jgi:diguanylate cyclase (GGDEF)-like protein
MMIRFKIKALKSIAYLKPLIITITGCIGIIVLWTLDYYVAGQDITFTLLYLIPVGITAWFGGLAGGIITSILSTLTWFFVYFNQGEFPDITPLLIINFFLKLIFYIVFSFMLYRLKQNLIREKKISATDDLTNAINRRAFNAILKSEIFRASRYNHPISLIYFDVDNFKSINDNYGHITGDKVLKKISETAKSNLRNTDFFARMGGDEFAVLLPETAYQDAEKAAAALFEALNSMSQKQKFTCSFSMGMVTYHNMPQDPGVIISKADNLMYYSKKHGKNRITSENCISDKSLPKFRKNKHL